MFEAGALSKNLDIAKVCVLLFGVEPTDLKGPLVQFQAASFVKTEIMRLVRTINDESDGAVLAADVLERVFEKWWPELEQEVKKAMDAAGNPEPIPQRSDHDMLAEILDILRKSNRSIGAGTPPDDPSPPWLVAITKRHVDAAIHSLRETRALLPDGFVDAPLTDEGAELFARRVARTMSPATLDTLRAIGAIDSEWRLTQAGHRELQMSSGG